MPVYRTAMSNIGQHRIDFFYTLTECLSHICKDAGISQVLLAPVVEPSNDHPLLFKVYERDLMLLHNGAPLLAVFLRYQCSGGLPDDAGYHSAPGYLAGAGTLADVQRDLGERLRAATKAEQPRPAEPAFNEGVWTMVLRTFPQAPPTVFRGAPLDIDAIDHAFTVMVDMLLDRLNTKTAKA